MRKFIETIEAIQYDGKNISVLEDAFGAKIVKLDSSLLLCTIPGHSEYAFEKIEATDWVIKRRDGTFQVMEHEIFKRFYEPANNTMSGSYEKST